MGERKQCMGCMEFYDSENHVCPHCGYDPEKDNPHVLHMTPGTLLHRRYVVGKALGYGSFGVTYIGWDKLLRHKVAIKEYLPSEFATRTIQAPELMVSNDTKRLDKYRKGLDKFHKEAEKLAHVGQIDGVVYIYDTFEENNTAYIVMEYLEGETLASVMRNEGIMTEQRAMDLMLPILQALDLVHEKGLIHRDISPQNIFISTDSAGNQKVKLIDFGAARFATSSSSKSLTVVLRPGYSPEEQYRSSGEQGPHTDIYAVAAVMYEMVTGVHPADALERRASIERKKEDILRKPSDYNKDLSENFETALLNAMNVKIEDRTPTAEAFVNELLSFEKVKRRGNTIRWIDPLTWPKWAKIGVPAAAVAAAGLFIGLGMYVSSLSSEGEFVLAENQTLVPSFIGSSKEQAESQADRAGLLLSVKGTEYSNSMASNLVLRQDVSTGSIRNRNQEIYITISDAEQNYYMPDVVGMSLDYARDALEQCMGVVVETTEVKVPGLADNCVVTQDIEAFEDIVYGGTVKLEVNKADDEKGGKAPSLVGLNYEKALAEAEKAGVQLEVIGKEFTDAHERYTIVEQDVKSGEKADGRIGVVLSLPMREFDMPSVSYKNVHVAEQLLKNIGLNSEITKEVSEIVELNNVVSQGTDPKTTVRPGETIQLVVSSGTTPFAIENVVNKSYEEAFEILNNQKLSVSQDFGYEDGVEEGMVISQSINEGSEVRRGSQVILTVCSFMDTEVVANVVGNQSSAATSTLESLGFKVKLNSLFSSTIPSGVVYEQDKIPGKRQLKGSQIILTVSKGVDPATIRNNESTNNTVSNSGTASNSGNKTDPTPVPEKKWHWSEWSPNAPVGNEYETAVEYRKRTRDTITSSEPTLAGWTLYDQTSSYSNYGNWSSWSPTPVSADDLTQVETRTTYSYSDMEYTTSGDASLSGWTQTGSSYGDWGNWTEWIWTAHIAPPDSSDVCEVQTAEGHRYYRYNCPSCGAGMPYYGTSSYAKCYTELGGCGRSPIGGGLDYYGEYAFPQSKSEASYWDYGKYTLWNGYFYLGEFNDTVYHYRTRSKTYSYQRQGAMSSYSTTKPEEKSGRVIESRPEYHYRKRTLNTTYYYEKWSAYTDYSTVPIAADANTDVQTRPIYRYKIYE